MKTLRTTTIIAGIIVALISLTAHAENITEKKAEEKKAILESMGITMDLEHKLIMQYIEEQETLEIIPEESIIMVYDMNCKLVFEGNPDSAEGIAYKLTADFLMNHENAAYYILD
jgi:nitrogenase subunit NifH